jgi:hypothetical protein
MRYTLTITAVLLTFSVFGQNKVESGNFNNWFFLHPQFSTAKHWTFASEIHIRRDDWVKNGRNILIRPYVVYDFGPKVDFAAGYTYIRSWGVKPTYAAGPSNEHNIWEQVSLHHQLHKLEFSHRYRFEHRFRDRWVEGDNELVRDGTDFSNRFRYRMILKYPIAKIAEHQEVYAHVFDEIWVNQYDYMLFKNLARNWFYAGLGYKLNKEWSVELGYMNQFDFGVPNVKTHLLQLSIGYHFKVSHNSSELPHIEEEH